MQAKEKTRRLYFFLFKSAEKQGKGTTCSLNSIFWGLFHGEMFCCLQIGSLLLEDLKFVCVLHLGAHACWFVWIWAGGDFVWGFFVLCKWGFAGVGGRRLLSLGKCSKQVRNHLFSRNEQLDLHETLWERSELQHLVCHRYLWWDRLLGFYPSGRGEGWF